MALAVWTLTALLVPGDEPAQAARAGSASGGQGSLSWLVTPSPFRLVVVADGRPLVTGASDTAMVYVTDRGRAHRVTRLLRARMTAARSVYTVATDEDGRTATATVTRHAGAVRVEWTFGRGSSVDALAAKLAPRRGERFLGGGQRGDAVELRGTATMKVAYWCDRTLPMPFLLSSGGYGLYLDVARISAFALPGSPGTEGCPRPPCPAVARASSLRLCASGDRLTYEIYAGEAPQVLSRYTATIGRAPLPPPEQFALIKWRDEVQSAAELLEDVDELQRRGIPLGWVLLDNPWETRGCIGALEFDRGAFPDPKGLIDAVHARGVRFMLWVAPIVRQEQACSPHGYPPAALVGSDVAPVLDLTDPAASAEFRSRLRSVVDLGVDGIKGDRGDEVDLEHVGLLGGPGSVLHNRYPYLFASAVVDVLRERSGGAFSTLFRAGTVGSQRVLPGVWAGDQLSTYDGLRAAIRMGQTAGVGGYPIWGSDVGGYSGGKLTAELFARWAQLGAVSPIFEVGGANANARFWELGEEATSLLRDAALLHYELFPHLYELARRAARTGMPILRPLALHHPEDPRSWRHDLQLLVGEELLAAPVTDSVDSQRVFLPAGSWVDLHRGGVLSGGRLVPRRTPLRELPLYLRRGAAIPFDARTPVVWSVPWGVDDLGRRDRAGWLVAPPSKAVATASAAGKGSVRVARSRGSVTIEVRGAPREVQVLVVGLPRPTSVEVDGRPLPASDLRSLAGRAAGWTSVPGRFPGTTIKVTTRTRAGRIVLRIPVRTSAASRR